MLILFAKALGTHRGIRHPPKDEKAEDDGDDTVSHEQPLPRSEGAVRDQSEAVSEESADNLLRAVHHIPVGNPRGLFFASIPHGGEDHKSRLASRLEQP